MCLWRDCPYTVRTLRLHRIVRDLRCYRLCVATLRAGEHLRKFFLQALSRRSLELGNLARANWLRIVLVEHIDLTLEWAPIARIHCLIEGTGPGVMSTLCGALLSIRSYIFFHVVVLFADTILNLRLKTDLRVSRAANHTN